MKADPNSNVMPCLLCSKECEINEFQDSNQAIEVSGYDKTVACHTHGNWGSQVHDEFGLLSFVICDRCIIKHSEKMLFRSYYDATGNKTCDGEPSGYQVNAREMYEKNHEAHMAKGPSECYVRDVAPYFED